MQDNVHILKEGWRKVDERIGREPLWRTCRRQSMATNIGLSTLAVNDLATSRIHTRSVLSGLGPGRHKDPQQDQGAADERC